MRASSTFQIKSWDEKPFSEIDGTKLTRASVLKSFQGDLDGEGSVEYVMFYRADGTASFVGLERIVGRVGDRKGSFVLEHRGIFEQGVAKDTGTVVFGSGTGQLRGLKGEVRFSAGHAQHYPIVLEYDFD